MPLCRYTIYHVLLVWRPHNNNNKHTHAHGNCVRRAIFRYLYKCTHMQRYSGSMGAKSCMYVWMGGYIVLFVVVVVCNSKGTAIQSRNPLRAIQQCLSGHFSPVYEPEEGDYCLLFAEMAAAHIRAPVVRDGSPFHSLEYPSCTS